MTSETRAAGAVPGDAAPRAPVGLLAGLVAVGAVAFVAGLLGGATDRTWAAFLVNLLFWSGLAAAGPAIAGMFEVSEARWASRLRRIATTTAAFMPVSAVLFLVLFLALGVLYPWVREPVGKKALWLNVPFLAARILLGVAALYWVSIRFAQAVHASPAGAAQEPGRAARQRLAVTMLFLFVIVVSLFGFDLVMSLDPHWFSGLLGGYFVVGTIYSGFAFLVLLVALRSRGRPAWLMPPEEVQDLAKLVFATSILWMYFFWSQYIVIWYGNVPIETRFVVARFFSDPWRALAITACLIGWVIPFSYLLARLTGRPPARHGVLVGVACLSLAAIFLERTVLVYPSVLRTGASAAYGIVDVLVTVGFGALSALSYVVLVPRLGLQSRLE
jgi:Ni/Fe-hydrogenase subunit HybB-like protein